MRFALDDRPSRLARYSRRALLVLAVLHIPIWISSTYRAWVQIRDVVIHPPVGELRAGSTVSADVVSWGRTVVAMKLELVQNTTVVRLGLAVVPGHRVPGYDFRSLSRTLTVVLPDSTMQRFQTGPAELRATALGSPQWLRTPPPSVRSLRVVIARPAAKT